MADDVMTDEYDQDQRYQICLNAWEDKKSMAKAKAKAKEEKRTMSFPVELRVESEENETPKIRGHAAVFNQQSDELGIFSSFREQIAPGAFKRTIKKADVRALFNHDPNYVLGRTKSKTLSLSEDDEGLAVEIDPPDTQWARDLMVSIKRGDISQMSFAFRTVKEQWDEEKKVRTLLDVDLYDVSPVTYPAYPQTDVGLRSLQEAGIDYESIAEIITKEELAEDDQNVLRSTIDILQSYLPDAETNTDGGDEAQEQHGQRVDVLRRELELLAI